MSNAFRSFWERANRMRGFVSEGFNRYHAVGWSSAYTGTVTGYSGATGNRPNCNKDLRNIQVNL